METGDVLTLETFKFNEDDSDFRENIKESIESCIKFFEYDSKIEEVSTEGFGETLKEVIEKIWEYIKTAFNFIMNSVQQLIIAITNFFRKGGLKKKNELYDLYNSKLDLIKRSGATVKVRVPSHPITAQTFADLSNVGVSFYNKYWPMLKFIIETVNKIIDRNIPGERLIGKLIGSKILKELNELAANIRESNMTTQITDIIDMGFDQGSSKKKILKNNTPGIYGNLNEPREVTVGEYLELVSFDLLSDDSSDGVVCIIENSKMFMKNNRRFRRELDNIKNKLVVMGEQFPEVSDEIGNINRIISFVFKNINIIMGIVPAIYNTIFNRYLNVTGDIVRCIKAYENK